MNPAPPRLALGMDVRDMPILVVGAGAVAERRVRRLLSHGATRVTVVAPEASPGMLDLAATHGDNDPKRLTVLLRPVRPEDTAGMRLVVTVTDDPAVNAEIAESARRSGALVNRADSAGEGDVTFPATMEPGGGLALALLGAEAASPVLSRWLLRRAVAALPAELDDLVSFMELARASLSDLPSALRARRLHMFLEELPWDILRSDGPEAALSALRLPLTDGVAMPVDRSNETFTDDPQ